MKCGHTLPFKAAYVKNYKKLADAAIGQDLDKVAAAAERLGYAVGETGSQYRELVLELFMLALEPLRHDVTYDFGRSDMARKMSEMGPDVTYYKDFWQAPPTYAVYFHRTLGCMARLASRLKARGNVDQLMHRWLARSVDRTATGAPWAPAFPTTGLPRLPGVCR